MKKRVLSLFLAFVLSFSMMPMSAFAEEAGTVTEQEAQSGEDTVEVSPTGEDTVGVSTSGEDTVDVFTTGEDISSGNAVTKDAAVEAAQSLIDALPEEVTAENADGLQAQLMAIDEALAALTEEQTAKLDMTRYENICAVLTTFVAAQDGEHTHPICGSEECTHANTHTSVEWKALSCADDGTLKIGGEDWSKSSSDYYELPEGSYYLADELPMDASILTRGTVNLCLNGKSITGNGEFSVIIVVYGTFNLCDCNSSTGNGKITHSMNGSTRYTGRGVSVSDGSAFNMYGGMISDNEATVGGGGVYLNSKCTFNMYGGMISNNKSTTSGGGVYAYNGTFNMHDGTITGNTTKYSGGGVYARESLQISGGYITNNTAQTSNGGGVYYAGGNDGETSSMSNVKITGNTAKYSGGGVYMVNDYTFSMSDVTITGNTANNGGGMYMDGKEIEMTGEMKITGNSTNDVYLPKGIVIKVKEGLSSSSSIGVSTSIIENDYTVIAEGSDHTLTEEDRNVFTSADGYAKMDMGNSVALVNGIPHWHPICGDKDCSEHGDNVYWMAVSTETDLRAVKAGTADAPKYYYLLNDVELTSTWTPKENVVLCLNGHSITMKASTDCIKVTGNFTLCDCDVNGNGKVKHAEESEGNLYSGRAINVSDGGTFTMYGGTITDNRITNNRGAGVNVDTRKDTFKMYGGKITGNLAEAGRFTFGAGVHVEGKFFMTGGEITDNTVVMDTTIESSSPYGQGGGVCVNIATCRISGDAKIYDNRQQIQNGSTVVNTVANNVYLVYYSTPWGGPTLQNITVDAPLSDDAKIGVTVGKDLAEGEYFAIATGTDDYKLTADDLKIFSSDAGYMMEQMNNTFIFGKGELHVHAVCGAALCTDGHEDKVWKAVGTAADLLAIPSAKETQYYYLTDDIELNESWNPTGDIALCLNGHSITANGDFDTIIVGVAGLTGDKFQLCDCNGSGENKGRITHADNTTGRGIYVTAGTTFYMYGGSITGNSTGENGGGVYFDGGYGVMWGGSITDNSADDGGGVAICTGTFYDAYDQRNYTISGYLWLRDGTITGNRATNGGGVAVKDATSFRTFGGSVTGNTATGKGGGVYVDSSTGKIIVCGDVNINGNKDEEENESNVYLPGGTNIIIDEKLPDNTRVGVTVETLPADGDYVKFAEVEKGVSADETANKFTIDNNSSGIYSVRTVDNSLYVTQGELHKHAICGKECSHETTHDNVLWTPLTYNAVTQELMYGSKVVPSSVKMHFDPVDKQSAYYTVYKLPAGNYYLADNITLTGGEVTYEGSEVTSEGGLLDVGTYGSVAANLCLNGKTLTTTTPYCGAIDVGAKGTLILSDCEGNGQITSNCNAENGVQIYRGEGTMYGGKITGTKCGVFVDGIFNMYGGTITGNTKGVDAPYDTSKVTVGGTVKITGNLFYNVYLGNTVITIDESLTDKAEIGVSTGKTLTAETPVQIATGATSVSLKYTEIFKPDGTGKGYMVIKDGTDLYLNAHEHNWTYTKSSDGKTITASCDAGNCPSNGDGGRVTIKAPAEENLTYDGKAKTAKLEGAFTNGESKPEISYKDKDNNPLEAAPTDAGSYTASITVGGVTASVDYEIKKATPDPSNFTFTVPSDLTYDGSAKFATVNEMEGMGKVTVKYYQGDSTLEEVQEPTNAGTYIFKISVAEGANYEAADNLTRGDWVLVIEPNKTTPKVELSGDTTYTYTGTSIQPSVTVTVDDKLLVKDKDYTVSYDDNTNAGKNAGKIYIYSNGNYGFEDYTQTFDIEKAEQKLSFQSENVDDKTYSDCGEFVTNPLTRTVVAGAVTYSSSNEDVATVDSDGIAAIVGVGTANITATAGETENYKIGTATYTLTVGKAHLRVNEAPSVDNKDYDGKTDAEVTVFFVNEKDRPVTLAKGTDYTVTGTFRSPDASDSEQTVDVEITLSEDCAKNYELETDTYTASGYINKRPISIESASAVDRVYEQSNYSVEISGVTFNGVVEGEELKKDIDYEVSGDIYDDNAGTKDDVDVTVTLTGKAANNYDLGGRNTTQTTVNIKQATPVITVAAPEQTIVKNGAAVYISDWASINNTDDTTLTYKLVGTPAGITLEGVSLTAENAASTVSSFEIRVTADATTNFTEPEEKIITVKVTDKADAGVRITGETADKTYGDKDFTLKATKTVPDGGTWSWSSDASGVLEISDADTDTPTIKVKKAGTAILTVTYISDDYYGFDSVSIIVNRKAVTADMIADIPAQEYTGSAIEPDFEVKDGTILLIPSADFTYNYSGNTNLGTATLTITGKGNYTGTASRDFTISPKSINGAVIALDAESFAYTGTEQTVSITSVTLSDGTVLGACDYVIKDNSNKATNASDSITLNIEGRGNYTGTATTTWKITKIDPELKDFVVTPEDLTTALTYDGKAKTVNVTTADGIQGMGKITVKYNGSTQSPTNAGNYEVTFEAADGMNYNAGTFNVGTLTIKKADAPTLKDIEAGYKYTLTGVKTVELTDLVANATGYKLGAITGDTDIISDSSVDADGILKFKLTGKGVIGDTVTLPVTITSVNYEDTTVKVVITLTVKDDQAALSITGDNTVVYGKTLTLGTTGGSGTGKVTYSIVDGSTGEATIDADGVLTPVKVGSITVKATKASDADYNEATSAAFVITITKAGSTGEPKYTVITTEGKTLADAGLTLTGSTLNPAEGTLKWVDEAGNELSADTKVEVNKTYKWLFTPANDNYEILTGEMILYSVYQILDGANSSWTQNTDGSGSIKIRGNGAISKFRNVMVDGNIIDPSNYTASEGSTIIELHEDYLKTLSEGIHTLAIVWTDGSASTNFTVAKNTADDDDDNDDNGGSTNTAGSSDNTAQTLTKSPKTGDASGLWIALFAASAAGLAVMLVRRKKY